MSILGGGDSKDKKVMSGVVESGVSMNRMKAQADVSTARDYSKVGLVKSAERMHYDNKPQAAHVTGFDGKKLFESDFKNATQNKDGSISAGDSRFTQGEYRDLKTQFNNAEANHQHKHDEWYTTAWRNGWIAGSPFERDVPRQ